MKDFSIKAAKHFKLMYLCVSVLNIWRHQWPQWLKHGSQNNVMKVFERHDTFTLFQSLIHFEYYTHPYEYNTALGPLNLRLCRYYYTYGNFTILTLIFHRSMLKYIFLIIHSRAQIAGLLLNQPNRSCTKWYSSVQNLILNNSIMPSH